MHKDYFEGILQLRSPTKEIIKFINNEVNKSDTLLVSNQKKVKNGIDYYMTSQKYLQQLGKKLKKNFCGDLKISSKLFSRNRQTSKNIYRVNVLFRCISCKIGDVIEYKGDQVKIQRLGKKILVKNIKTSKNLNLDYKDL